MIALGILAQTNDLRNALGEWGAFGSVDEMCVCSDVRMFIGLGHLYELLLLST